MSTQSKRILVADDENAIRRLLDYNLRKAGFEPVLAADGREAIAMAEGEFACALVDLKMPEVDGMGVLDHFKKHHPETPVVIMSALGEVSDAVAAMKAGAMDYVAKPFDLDEVMALATSASRMGRALQENRQLRDTIARTAPDLGFAGDSEASRNLLSTVQRVAPLDSTLLITGESGVGKSFLARMIHRASKRAGGPFIITSCPALPRELLESEMFGHERGAFTGAEQRRLGRIEMAEGGTLFLDEIGDLPLLLQPKLLNFLQDRQFTRLGGSTPIAADIRIIAATNSDLKERVDNREFREDLYYRINVFPVHIPPLRERLTDLPPLCHQILGRISQSWQRPRLRISQAALSLLAAYRWPGNVRELENVLERAAVFCENDVVEERHLPAEILSPARPVAAKSAEEGGSPAIGGMALEDLERLAIRQTLELCRGNKAMAARRLGITEKSIYNKMTRLGLR